MKLLTELKHQLIDLHNSASNSERVILTNMEEFVEDSIEGEDYYETETHYVSYCPYCVENITNSEGEPYTKKKLYISKDYSRSFCQRCHSTYFNYTTDLEFSVIAPKTKLHEFTLNKLAKKSRLAGVDYSLHAYESTGVDIEGIMRILSRRNIHKLGREIGEPTLIRRNTERYRPLVDKLGIRGTSFDNNHGVLMIPFYINDELIYWQSNLVGGNPKYFMPPIEHKPFYMPINRGKKIVIVEGIYDAMACLYLYPDRTPIALLGSYITDYHIWLLRNYVQPVDCLIQLDNINLSVGVLLQMRRKIPTIVNFNLFAGKYDVDPDEILTSMDNNQLEEFKITHRYANNFEWE